MGLLLSVELHRMVRRPGLVALIALVVLAAGLGQTSLGHAMLQKTGLYKEPASYTSLAFLHPQSLTEQLPSKRSNVGVSFVIRNVSGTARDYQWSVLLNQGRRTSRVAAGSVRVGSGRDVIVSRATEIFCKQGRVQFIVTLARPAESIDAWTACWSHRR